MKAAKMLLFDEKKFMIGNEHSYYSLAYDVFRSDKDTSEMSTEAVRKSCGKVISKTGQACFANFRESCLDYLKSAKVKPNRIRLFCEANKHTKKETHLNKEEIEEWVKVCKKNNLMPENIGKNFIENGIYDICFDDISMEMLYVYLCAGRYVQEEPFFVKGVLYLMDSHKMGFFTSFCLASYYQATNSGHHILPFSRNYMVSQMPKTLNEPKSGGFGNSFNMIYAARLYSFVHGGDKGKKIKEFDADLPRFALHEKMTSYWDKNKPNNYNVSRNNLKNKRLESILKSGEFGRSLSTP